MENTIIVCGDSGVGKKTFKNYVNDERITVVANVEETFYAGTQIQKSLNNFKGAFIMMSTDIQYNSSVINNYITLLKALDISVSNIILLINKFDKDHKLDVNFYNKVCNQLGIYGCIIVSSKTGFGMTYCMAQMNNLLSKDGEQNNKLTISTRDINAYLYDLYSVACGLDYDVTIKEIKICLGSIYFKKDTQNVRTLLNDNKELYHLMTQIQDVCMEESDNRLKCTKIQEILLKYGSKYF
jgi:predicted GTPase